MNLKDILKVKVAKNLKMGTERVSAGTIFDVSQNMPQWIRKELEFGLGTVVVTERKQSAPKKIENTESTENDDGAEEKPAPKKKSTKSTKGNAKTTSTTGTKKKSTKKKKTDSE